MDEVRCSKHLAETLTSGVSGGASFIADISRGQMRYVLEMLSDTCQCIGSPVKDCVIFQKPGMLRKLNAMPMGQILTEFQLKSHVLPLWDVLFAQQGLEDLLRILSFYSCSCAAMKTSHMRMS